MLVLAPRFLDLQQRHLWRHRGRKLRFGCPQLFGPHRLHSPLGAHWHEDWCINQDKIDKIIGLAREIIESKTNYILAKAETKTALYDNELLVVQHRLNSFPPDIDRWLALLVGNTLFNNVKKEIFFNWNIKNYDHLFDLIKNWNCAYRMPAPVWGTKLFMGINMSDNTNQVVLACCSLVGIDFSHSYFENLTFMYSDIRATVYLNMHSLSNFDLAFTHIGQNIQTPIQLARLVDHGHAEEGWSNFGSKKTYIGKESIRGY